MPKRNKSENSKGSKDEKASKRAKGDSSSISASNKANEPNKEKLLLEKYKNKKEKLCFNEVKGDLFQSNPNVSLAHCVSLDFKMGAGIAVEFKKRFKGTGELTEQNKELGQCAYLKRDTRHIFYLITKKVYNQKPNYVVLEKCLLDLLALCKTFNVQELAMPRIGCGLDNLDWDYVSRIIDGIFESSGIQITVYYL